MPGDEEDSRPFVEPPVAFGGLTEDEIKRLLTEKPKPVEIPKAWGKFAGTFVWSGGSGIGHRFVTFEAADGALRTTSVCLPCDMVRK